MLDRARNAEDSISPLSFQETASLGYDIGTADPLGIDAAMPWGGGADGTLVASAGDAAVADAASAAGVMAVLPAARAGWWYAPAKRVLDLGICLAILPILVPLAGLIAIAVRLDSSGPVIFRQTRIGRQGLPFQILKFRTLRADHDQQQDRRYMEAFIQGRANEFGESGEHVVNKPIQPSALTRVGRLLRRSSLDELPQIVNVWRGEMSLVGPRPNVPWEVDAYLDWHRERLEVTPGITGLAQVRGRSCVTFDTIAAADIEYVRRRSPWLDLEILWRTVVCLFSGDGGG